MSVSSEPAAKPIYSVVRLRSRALSQVCGVRSRLIARGSLLRFVGDLTAGDPPVPIPNTEVKPRRADGTARESVWERRSLPALIKARLRNQSGLFLFAADFCNCA